MAAKKKSKDRSAVSALLIRQHNEVKAIFKKLEGGRAYLWGKVRDDQGKECVSRLETVSGYILTAKTAVLIAQKIMLGNFKQGYQTPSMAYGEDFIMEIESTKRTDVS